MTAKEYLSQLKWMQISLHEKEKSLDDLRAEVSAIGGFDYSKERVQTSISPDAPYTLKIEKIAELEEKIKDDLTNYLIRKEEITDQIQALKDPLYTDLLYQRYVEFKRLEQIAVEMNFSYTHVRHLHGQALQKFEKKWMG